MDLSGVILILGDLGKATKRIGQAGGAIQEAANELAEVIEKLQRAVARAIAGAPLTAGAAADLSFSLAKLKVELARILRDPENPSPKQWYPWQPDVSATVVDIKRQADGSAIVSIDGKKLAVPPALGDLVSELIVDNGGPSPDDLIPFKPLPDLALKLQKLKGRPFSKHAVNQLIYRLRRLLHQHGFPQALVQTNRRAGVRLALRRRGPEQAAHSPLG